MNIRLDRKENRTYVLEKKQTLNADMQTGLKSCVRITVLVLWKTVDFSYFALQGDRYTQHIEHQTYLVNLPSYQIVDEGYQDIK